MSSTFSDGRSPASEKLKNAHFLAAPLMFGEPLPDRAQGERALEQAIGAGEDSAPRKVFTTSAEEDLPPRSEYLCQTDLPL